MKKMMFWKSLFWVSLAVSIIAISFFVSVNEDTLTVKSLLIGLLFLTAGVFCLKISDKKIKELSE
jgi:uncharacterized membrane protein HdeD (DUF308 family)